MCVTAFLFEAFMAFICRVQAELGGSQKGTTFPVGLNGRDTFCLRIRQKACEELTVLRAKSKRAVI